MCVSVVGGVYYGDCERGEEVSDVTNPEIYADYLAFDVSIPVLAERHGVHFTVLRAHAEVNGWETRKTHYLLRKILEVSVDAAAQTMEPSRAVKYAAKYFERMHGGTKDE